MALNDQNRSRKTYSFFRAAPVPTNRLVTLLSAGYGLQITGDSSQVTYSLDPGVTPVLTGVNTFSGSSTFTGLSGSLQQVTGGLAYLAQGVGIQVTTQSNGQVIISAATGSLTSASYSVPRNVDLIIVSGALSHVTMSLSSNPLPWQRHTFKDADGRSVTRNIIISASAGMRIDGGRGHEISSSYGRASLVFVGSGLWNITG